MCGVVKSPDIPQRWSKMMSKSLYNELSVAGSTHSLFQKWVCCDETLRLDCSAARQVDVDILLVLCA